MYNEGWNILHRKQKSEKKHKRGLRQRQKTATQQIGQKKKPLRRY